MRGLKSVILLAAVSVGMAVFCLFGSIVAFGAEPDRGLLRETRAVGRGYKATPMDRPLVAAFRFRQKQSTGRVDAPRLYLSQNPRAGGKAAQRRN
jgi:hypothetical protein